MSKKEECVMKIVIGGCRTFKEYDVFCAFVNDCLEELQGGEELTFLSGHCAGVDLMAERYAQERGLALEIFPANWAKYGRAAGPIRNREMVKRADVVIAFWDGASRGTKSLIGYAKECGKALYIKRI